MLRPFKYKDFSKKKGAITNDDRNIGGRGQLTQEKYNHYKALLTVKPTIKLDRSKKIQATLNHNQFRPNSIHNSDFAKTQTNFLQTNHYDYPNKRQRSVSAAKKKPKKCSTEGICMTVDYSGSYLNIDTLFKNPSKTDYLSELGIYN